MPPTTRLHLTPPPLRFGSAGEVHSVIRRVATKIRFVGAFKARGCG